MIIVLKPNVEEEKIKGLEKWIKDDLGLEVHYSRGKNSTILGLVGDTSKVDHEAVNALDIVESVTRIQEPYKAANRKFHPEDTVISVGDVKIGGGNFVKIAGPCSVETIDQITAKFPHWFAPQCRAKWRGKDWELPFYQHWLLGAVAPRLLAVGSAEDDWWACPSAEFCSWECSRVAFQQLKCQDRTTYHVRHGGHDLTPEDWREYLDFAEKHGWMASRTP